MRPGAARGTIAAAAVVAALAAWWALRSRPVPAERPDPEPVPAAARDLPGAPAPEDPDAAVDAVGPVDAAPEPDRLRGVVVDSGDAPAAGAEVRLGRRRTETDAGGRFELPVPAFRADGSGGVLVAAKEGHGTAQVEVRRGGPRDLRVVLPPAAAIEGVVLGPGGPLASARVTLLDGEWERTVETGADGRFRFREARTTRCEVVAEAKDHRPAGAGVAAGIGLRTVVLALDPSPEEFSLFVEDRAGHPVPGARVGLRYDVGHGAPGGARVRRVTDAAGFAMRLPRHAGNSTVSVEAAGFAPGGAPLPWNLTEDVVVTLDPEADLEVRAPAGLDPSVRASWTFGLAGWFRPRSADEGGGYGPHPGPYGNVEEHAWVGFDEEGRARLTGAREGGRYAILAQRRDPGGVRQSFRVVAWRTEGLPAGTTVVDWTPPALAPLRIRVEDAATASPLSAKVMVGAVPRSDEEREEILKRGHGTSARTGIDGTGTAWVWPGRYRVDAYAGHGSSHEPRAESEIEVGPGGASVTLRIPGGTPVRGRLRTADGVPLAGRQVHLTSEPDEKGHRHLLMGTTDDGGRFEIAHAPDGKYGVWVQTIRGEMAAPEPASVTAPAGDLDLVVIGHTLRGDVRPVPDGPAFVRLQAANGGISIEAAVDDTGQFEFTGLAPGPKTLVVVEARRHGRILAQASATVPDDARVSIGVPPPPTEPESR